MLSFEDERSPSLQSAIRHPHSGVRAETAPHSAPDAEPDAKSRRVRVEDKRIINGSADVNQLVPFKYKWAW